MYKDYLIRLLLKDSEYHGERKIEEPLLIKIPSTVQSLTIKTNVLLEANDIPLSVKYIRFGGSFTKFPTANILSDSILCLFLNHKIKIEHRFDLPKFLERLYISNKSQCLLLKNNVPSSLYYLSFEDIEKNTRIPNQVKVLKFNHRFNKDIPTLPSGLERISIGNHFVKCLPCFPISIKHIKIGKKKPLDNTDSFLYYPDLELDYYQISKYNKKIIKNKVVKIFNGTSFIKE